MAAKGVPLSSTEAASEGEAATLLFGLGRAQAATLPPHEMKDAITTLSRALEYYVNSQEVSRAVAIAEYPLSPVPGYQTGVTELVARTLPLVSSGSGEEGRLLSRCCSVLGIEQADYNGAQEAAERALAIAHRDGDEVLEMRTLIAASQVEWWHLGWQECIENSLRLHRLARLAEDLFAEARGHLK